MKRVVPVIINYVLDKFVTSSQLILLRLPLSLLLSSEDEEEEEVAVMARAKINNVNRLCEVAAILNGSNLVKKGKKNMMTLIF